MTPIKHRFRKNTNGFWQTYRWFIILFAFALFCDGVTTVKFMLEDGTHCEYHPIIMVISCHIGPVLGPCVGMTLKFVIGLLVAISYRLIAPYIFVIASATALLAAWYNVWGVQMNIPALHWLP